MTLPATPFRFFVSCEFTPASVDSGVAWQGELTWEHADGSLETIAHAAVSERLITRNDRRVYGLSLPERQPLAMAFKPSARLRISSVAGAGLTLSAVLSMLLVTIRWRWRAGLTAAGLGGLATLAAGLYGTPTMIRPLVD